MLIIPAIDIKDGLVVRLIQGRFDKVTVYSEDPVSIAKKFALDGARLLHIVDLNGALLGKLKNLKEICDIAKKVNVPIEVGGGIRDKDTIRELFAKGIDKVVLSTVALEDSRLIKDLLNDFADKIVISIDSRGSKAASHGWQLLTEVPTEDMLCRVQALGVKMVIVTDIAKDGTLSGPNIENLKMILGKAEVPVISSGGISSLADIRALSEIKPKKPYGAIIGKALYEGRFTLKEAIETADACKENNPLS